MIFDIFEKLWLQEKGFLIILVLIIKVKEILWILDFIPREKYIVSKNRQKFQRPSMQIKNDKGDFFKTAKVFNIFKLILIIFAVLLLQSWSLKD